MYRNMTDHAGALTRLINDMMVLARKDKEEKNMNELKVLEHATLKVSNSLKISRLDFIAIDFCLSKEQ